MFEKIVPHKRIVALRMLARQAHILIHVESYHVGETYLLFLIQAN